MRLFDAIGRKAGTDKRKQSPQDSNVWRQITSSICFINAIDILLRKQLGEESN